jgi:peptide/nickel transport system substrate-binding protein
MSKKTPFLILALLIIASFILAACASEPIAEATEPPAPEATQPTAPEATEPPAPEPTAAPPAENMVAKLIWTQEFDNLNPLYTNMWFVSTTFPIWNCYAWTFDDQNNPIPVLITEMPSAENGGITNDGKTITLKLRDDIVWSDGTPITADDFIFTYQMTVDPNNAVAAVSPYDLIESMEAPDPQTVVTNFTEPYAPWMGQLWKGILPKHILQPVFDSAGSLNDAEWNFAPTVGCGPYNFAEWESGSFARFVANDNYWLGRPKIDELFFQFVPDDASQIAALQAGDGDLGTFFSWSDVPTLEEAGIKILLAYSGYNEGYYFNLNPEKGHPALQDLKVRQAIAYAIDREAISNDLLLGGTKPAATMWDNMPYVDPSITAYPFDPEMAKSLLDEAGWVDSNDDGTRDKDGVELMLRYGTTTREIRKDTQAVVQQFLADVGIGVELLNFESDQFFGGYEEGGPAATGQLDMFEYSTSPAFPDPDSADFLCSEIPSDEKPSGTNWEGWCDPDVDALFQAQASQVDFNTRQQTFYQISRLIYDNVYWLGLWQDPDLFGIGSRLQNVKVSGAVPFFNVFEWELTP